MKISQSTLLDYLDGSLPDRERQHVAQAIERDPGVREQLAALEELRNSLRTTFDAVHAIPLKGALTMAESSARPARRWVAAAAPLLALALLVGWLFSRAGARPPQSPTGNESGPASPATAAAPTPTWIPGPGTPQAVDPAGPTSVPVVTPLSSRAGTLFVVSDVLSSTEVIDSYAAVIDVASGAEQFISQATQILPSRDGSRWYALRYDGAQTAVVAYEASSGTELWYAPINQTVAYIGGAGPGILALSPAGDRLYVLSYDSGAGEQGPQWLQALDTATGGLAAETIVLGTWADCAAPQFFTPSQGTLIYIKCPTSVKVLDAATGTLSSYRFPVEQFIPQGFAISPDGKVLYGVGFGPTIVYHNLDPNEPSGSLDGGPVSETIPIDPGLVALSADGSRLVIGHVIEEVPGTATAVELRVYDARTMAEITRINYPKPIRKTTLAISGDGGAIYAVTWRATPATGPSEVIVEFDGASGAVRAEHLRVNENLLRLQFLP